jgi:hypothetical protein
MRIKQRNNPGREDVRTDSRQGGKQGVADYLAGLNRAYHAPHLTTDTGRLKAMAVANYFNWFTTYGIAIFYDGKDQAWKLGSDK